ncbi:hypothetical protein GCM10010339_25730 [Streptomyces alanosinicus]|uniref:Uncharacterized protein n=1 Tax=Streptomyces alanosinicus TaxID=68171 RepID=A0A918YGV6_9ACTN|nr:hypothetical protein GCM10010339_25730 [Streptomyces alanosinicus]
MRALAAGERADHLGGEPVGPREEPRVAGDVVEVQHRGPAESLGQLSGEGGLPRTGVPVDTDQPDRSEGGGKPAQPGGEIANGGSRVWVDAGGFPETV